ncbi:MAG: sacsin N-terminal ATP-binding-like domain-containing protein [Enterocloster sp.]
MEKYSDQAHFIYELIQNADDAGSTTARFILEPERLIFAHNGTRHFSISNPENEDRDSKKGHLGDINAITGIAFSNKKTQENKIGKFGVGFKAVFQYTATPTHILEP